jgi:hypothetical protein
VRPNHKADGGALHRVLRASGFALAGVLVAAALAANAADVQHLGDFQNYARGAYGAYASPWSTFTDKSLKRGFDYTDTVDVSPDTFPDNTVLNWRWPDHVGQKSGVWGYMHLFMGNYDGGKPPIPTQPRQVNGIHTLAEDFDLAYDGPPDFNLLNEFYLTSRAGDAAAKKVEIGYFLHVSPQGAAFFERGKPIGSYRDQAGRLWRVRMAGVYCMLVPADGRDLLHGSIDIRATLAFLQAKGVIKGDEWFNGIALGSEPIKGAGRLDVRHWKVVYN